MIFDHLDAKMRVYETCHDLFVLPGIYMVARLDGRGFTRLTKEVLTLEAPFDRRFSDHMVATVEHLMACGPKVLYGYTQSDEISLLMGREEQAFNRKLRKLNSVLAGEASAKLSLLLGQVAAFDCRISQLPSQDLVVDYFRWRGEDAHRNGLSAHGYWGLRKAGRSQREATAALEGLSPQGKLALLASLGISFSDLPAWHRRGVGVLWQEVERVGWNPVAQREVTTTRRRLRPHRELPEGREYDAFLRGILQGG